MILDDLLTLADGQSSTVAVASTNVIDTLADGDVYGGSMAGAFFYVRVATAYAATGAPTNTYQLQTSDDENFLDSTTETMVQSAGLLVADLTAGAEVKLPIPPGAKRYIRGYQSNTSSGSDTDFFSAGAFDMFISKDVDANSVELA